MRKLSPDISSQKSKLGVHYEHYSIYRDLSSQFLQTEFPWTCQLPFNAQHLIFLFANLLSEDGVYPSRSMLHNFMNSCFVACLKGVLSHKNIMQFVHQLTMHLPQMPNTVLEPFLKDRVKIIMSSSQKI